MLAFWLICALLVAAALLIVLPSLLTKHPQVRVSRRTVNRAIFDRKLGELEEDLERNLIDEGQFESAKSDLKRTLIDDLAGYKEPFWKRGGKLLPILVLVSVPAASVFLYLKINNGLASLSGDFQVQAELQGSMPSVEQAIVSLEERLKIEPNNLDGWMMLGRSYLVLERYGDAVAAYKNANELTQGANPDVLVAYAEVQAFASGQHFNEEAMALLTQALQIDPEHERGLWYAGYAAYQTHDYKSAVKHWEILLRKVPSDQEEAQAALRAYLDDAKEKAGTEAAITAEKTEQGISVNGGANDKASLVVQVSVSDSLQEKIDKSDTLFIYARPLNGPRMPLALVRMAASSLPATVILDDSVAMIPEMTLSSMEQVEVVARVTKSGKAMMQSGDLYGSVQPVSTQGSGHVAVLISEIAP